MQKKLIALAVAGLVTGSAFAQVAPNNVTLYGIIDVGYQYVSKADAAGLKNHGQINSGGQDGSRFGFKGSEDLGNGLSVGFTTEFDFGTDFNAGTLKAVKNSLNLSGAFGTVTGGSFGTATDDINGYSEAGGMGWGNGVVGMIATGGDHFNAVKYNSPVMNGFDAMIAYSTHNADQQDPNTNTAPTTAAGVTTLNAQNPGYSARISYAPGPLKVGLAVQRFKGDYTGANSSNEWLLSAGYDFGMVKVGAGYDRARTTGDDIRKAWRINVGAPIGANDSVALSYSRVKVSLDAGGSDKASGLGLSYNHNLSKRTNVYATYGQVQSESGADIANVTDGYDRAFKVGVRHQF